MEKHEIIYVSCAFGGDKERIKYAEECIKKMVLYDQDLGIKSVYLSPLHTVGFLYEMTEYEEGLDMTLALLDKCDRMVVLDGWENSKGCLQEIGYCKAKGIPIEYYDYWKYDMFDLL